MSACRRELLPEPILALCPTSLLSDDEDELSFAHFQFKVFEDDFDVGIGGGVVFARVV